VHVIICGDFGCGINANSEGGGLNRAEFHHPTGMFGARNLTPKPYKNPRTVSHLTWPDAHNFTHFFFEVVIPKAALA
jgi:hypothetical protein